MSTSAKKPASAFGKRLRDSQVSADTGRARFAYVDARSLSDCPTWQEKLERVRAYIDAMSERPNLLVIDTLGFWAGLSDFNDYATVSREFKPVLDFAQGTSVAVLLVHHSRKGNGTDIDAISGSNALAANAGAVALLSKIDGNDTQRKLTVWSRDVGEYELIVNYNPVSHFYDRPDPMDTIPEDKRIVLALLEDSAEGLTVKAVGQAYREANGLEDGHGLGDSRIRTILRALERQALAPQEGGKDASGKQGGGEVVCKSTSKVDGRWPLYIYILPSSHLPFSRFQYPRIPGVFSLALHLTLGMVGRELTGQDGDHG